MTGTHQDAKWISAALVGEWETLVTASRCTARKRESVTTSAERGNCSSRQLRAAYLRALLHPSTRPPNCSPPPAHRHSKYCTTEREDETPGPDKTNTTWQLQLTRDAYLNNATRRHGHARRPTQTHCSVESKGRVVPNTPVLTHARSAAPQLTCARLAQHHAVTRREMAHPVTSTPPLFSSVPQR